MNPIFIILAVFGLLAVVECRQNMDRAPVVPSQNGNTHE
jgi:hypothetical protein